MAGSSLGEIIGMKEELIKKACSMAMKDHKSKPYVAEKSGIRGSFDVIFSFAGSWSVQDWYAHRPFGETKIDLKLFPALKSIGNDEVAIVNEAFLRRFKEILERSSLRSEVEKAVKDRKQIVFTGHSSGGPMAILATLWFLENWPRSDTSQMAPLCVTFGSPLVGGRIFSHALRRENWSRHFIHFVMRYDIVPRIMLAPLSSIESELQPILNCFKSKSTGHGSIVGARENFYVNVMRNASSVASYAACYLMGCTNLLVETLTNFVELSPYRPFGTYVFCTGNGKLVVVSNPEAILQLLFYCPQLGHEAEVPEIAHRSLNEHLAYESELRESLEMQNVFSLNKPEELPLSSDEAATINMALNDLGLSARARLCLRAAGELEKQRLKNQEKIDANESKIQEDLGMLEQYKANCFHKAGYYDAFKLSEEEKDFLANVKRLDLAGLWDEIIEMLKRYELPDEFEGREEWIKLGTSYRRLVEPLDIANYYRHLKNEDTGTYLMRGRPKRYRYTQRWLEYSRGMPVGSCAESCFWAEVEELGIKTSTGGPFEGIHNKVVQLEGEVSKWVNKQDLTMDVFLKESTFVKWWKTLPHEHRSVSCIARFIE